MLLDSRSLLSVGEVAKNYKILIESVKNLGVLYLMRSITPIYCVVSAEKIPWKELPDVIPSYTTTFANQHFYHMLKYASRYGVVSLTKRGVGVYYVIDTSFMERFLDEGVNVDLQIHQFCTRFLISKGLSNAKNG